MIIPGWVLLQSIPPLETAASQTSGILGSETYWTESQRTLLSSWSFGYSNLGVRSVENDIEWLWMYHLDDLAENCAFKSYCSLLSFFSRGYQPASLCTVHWAKWENSNGAFPKGLTEHNSSSFCTSVHHFTLFLHLHSSHLGRWRTSVPMFCVFPNGCDVDPPLRELPRMYSLRPELSETTLPPEYQDVFFGRGMSYKL